MMLPARHFFVLPFLGPFVLIAALYAWLSARFLLSRAAEAS